jgi:hypothetical protein
MRELSLWVTDFEDIRQMVIFTPSSQDRSFKFAGQTKETVFPATATPLWQIPPGEHP